MRAPFLLLPLTLALTPMSVSAQHAPAPRVIFCTGQCFAVDDKGVRTPAPKGTELRPGQRLETGPGAYAQVRISPDAALGVGELARVGIDRKGVNLDQGRIRVVGGEAFGSPATQPLELHTRDGTLVLRNADVEVKTPAAGERTASSLTVVKLNVGDARFGDVPISRDSAQGIAAGKLSDRPVSVAEVALPPSRGALAPAAPVPAPVTDLPRTTLPSLPGTLPLVRSDPFVRPPVVVAPPPVAVVSVADKIFATRVTLPDGQVRPLGTTLVGTTPSIFVLDSAPTLSTTTLQTSTVPTTSTILLSPKPCLPPC